MNEEFGHPVLTVPLAEWLSAAAELRAGGAAYLDLLTAWEEPDGHSVALQVVDVAAKRKVRLQTHVPEGAELPSLTVLYPGVDWHERELAEMFGIDVTGHPNLVPLLVPDGHHPLRKDFSG